MKLITTLGKFHAATKFFMFMLAHLLPSLFDHTRHRNGFLGLKLLDGKELKLHVHISLKKNLTEQALFLS